MALALLLSVGVIQPPSPAQAAPPPPCPIASIPGGTTLYHVFATLPVGVPPASGVCIVLAGTGGSLSAGAVTQAPLPCPAIAPPATDAGTDRVWADWGAPCVSAGQTVVLQFLGMPGIPLGRQPGVAFWSNGVTTDATVWPTQCPTSPPGAGNVPLLASAIAPVGGPYDGVCITISAAAGGINTPIVLLNPAGCGGPSDVVGAAMSQVWDDWTVKCANSGGKVVFKFNGPPGLIGPCAGCAIWLGSAVIGDVTISSVSVGGVAEAPESAAPPASAASGGAGVDRGWYVGGAAFLLLAMAGGGWYARRRRSA